MFWSLIEGLKCEKILIDYFVDGNIDVYKI